MNVSAQQLHYLTGLLVVCVAGFLGGLVSAIGAMIESGRDSHGRYIATKGVPVWFFLLGRSVVGIGGATAVLLASLSVNKFTGSSDIDLLALSALCFVAGSIGYRLLPMVAAQLEKRIGEAEKKAEEAVKKVEKTSDSVELAKVVVSAMGVLDRKEQMPAIVDQTIDNLERLSKEFPTERSLHIVLGRMYREKKQDFDKAISVLRGFIKRKGKARDKDVADAYFNIACYQSLMAKVQTGEAKQKLIEEGLSALRSSLEIVPENDQDARTDDDLEELRAAPNFSEALKFKG